MSYILDALKKSEQERSLGALRKLHTPQAARADSERRVFVVLLVVLGLLVVSLAGMVIYHRDALMGMLDDDGSSPDPAAAPRVAEAPDEFVIDSTRIVEAAPDSGASPRYKADDAPAAAREQAAADRGASSEQAKGGAVPVSALPAELRTRLPPLMISVVSFSGDAARRFVMIDGGIYREGERLPDGIRVERIQRDRIEFSMLSERFYVTP